MSTLASDVLTELAYRFGEDSSPGNAAEAARRLSFVSRAYMEVFKRHMWWWTEKDGSPIATNEGQEVYDLPTDYRQMIEVRVGNVVYTSITPNQAFSTYNYPDPVFNLPYTQGVNHYYVFAGKLHLLPKTTANVAAQAIAIVRAGTTATATLAGHGFTNEDYITIAGCAQADYNGDFYITVIDENSFSFQVSGSPVTPASGTPTAQKKALRIKYYQKPTKVTTTSQTLLIPDEYAAALDAFAFARICQIDDERGSASDGFEEFEEVMKQMNIEQNKHTFWGKSVGPEPFI